MAEADELKERIARLKEELGAVIVAHNYQRPEVQDIADFVGDSLELARECTRLKARTIVFCGVQFMAPKSRRKAISAVLRRMEWRW
jgi:quinolinate synthase